MTFVKYNGLGLRSAATTVSLTFLVFGGNKLLNIECYGLTLYGHMKTTEQGYSIQQYGDCYTGR